MRNAWILIIALIIIGGGAAASIKYWMGSSQEGWKTYRSTDAGFEIDYPADWIVEEKSNGVVIRATTYDPPLGGTPPQGVQVSFKNRDASYSDVSAYYYGEVVPTLRTDIDHEVRHTMVSGHPAISYIELGMFEHEYTDIMKGSKLYTIFTSPEDKFRDVNSQIIPTFRFIE